MPATITWNTSVSPTGGDFSVGSNWVGGVVPGSSDDAVVNLTSVGTVAYNTAAPLTVGSITTNGNTTFNVNKGTVTIAASSTTGTFGAAVNVASAATLTAGSGAKVQLAGNTLITVNGSLTLASPASFVLARGGSTANVSGVSVATGGLFTATAATVSSSNPGYYGTTAISVAANGGFHVTDSTLGLDRVTLDPAATLGSTDVMNTAFDATVSTPTKFLPILAGNKRFAEVDLVGSTTDASLSVGPLGTDASQQSYVFPANFTVATGTALTFTAGSKVQTNSASVVTVNNGASLAINSPASVVAVRGGSTANVSGFAVAAGGTLQLVSAPVSSSNPGYYGSTSIAVAANGVFKVSGSTLGLDRVSLDPAATIGSKDITDTAFDTTLSTPTKFLPGLAGNKRFAEVDLVGSTTDASLSVGPLGTDASQQTYVFPTNFTVAGGTSLEFSAGSKVQTNGAAVVTVSGTLALTDPASVVAVRGGSSANVSGFAVAAGGTLQLTDANLTAANAGYYGTSQITVAGNASFQSKGSTIAWDNVFLNVASLLTAGDIMTTAFDTTLTTPAKYVPVFVGNKRFRDVNLIGGTNDPTLTLDPLGLNTTNQRYVFPAAGTYTGNGTFVVAAGTALNFTAGANIVLGAGAVVSINGTVGIDSPGSVVGVRGGSTGNVASFTVNGGGGLSLTNASLTATNPGYYGSAVVNIGSKGTFATSGSTYAWDALTIDPAATLGATAITSSAFDMPITLPIKYQPLLAGNKRFQDVNLTDTTVLSSLDAGPVGSDTTNMRYVLPGALTVAAGTTLNFTPGVKVLFNGNGQAAVNGTLTVDSAGSFVAARGGSSANFAGVKVANGGTFQARNTVFTATNAGYYGTAAVTVASGGLFVGVGDSFGWDAINLPAGSSARLQYNYFGSTLNVNSGANLAPNTVKNNDFTGVAVVASGGSSATIDLTNNYWGSTVPSVINGLITDHLDNVNLPTVTYSPPPVLTARPVQVLTGALTSVAYSSGDQTVSLSATFRSPSGSGLANVNGGTVTFTVKDGLGNTIGTPPAPVTVSAGVASATYTIPGGTNAGTYTVFAAFSGSGSFGATTDNSQTLTITPAPTATAAHDATRQFATAAGGVTLTADVTLTAGGLANGGAVVFSVYDATNTLVGTAQSVTVVNGVATGNYPLPANLPTGTYTIDTSYGGTINQGSSVDPVRNTFTITTAPSVVTAANATATFSGLAQNVTLTAAVTSPAGVVNNGTVTFTVRNSAMTVIGSAAGNVGGGTASAVFSVPANTPVDTYTIDAEYGSPIDYDPSGDAAHTLTVNPAPQTITFPTVPPPTYAPTLGITLGATGGGSGNAVQYSIVVVPGVSTGDGTISGNVLTVSKAGVIVVEADQAGNGNYHDAPSVTVNITIFKADQTITFPTVPPPVYLPGLSVPLPATGGASTSAINLAIVGGTGQGSISSGNLVVVQAGTFLVSVSQAGDDNYSPATTVTQTITILKAAQAITFTTVPPSTYTPAGIALSATGGASGNAVTFSIVAGGTGAGSVAGNVLTVTKAGSITVVANEPGNVNYNAAAQVPQTITVLPADQSITFPAIPSVTYQPGVTVNLSATGGASGSPVTFTVVSGPASVSGGVLTVLGGGAIVIAAHESGTDVYAAAADKTQTLVVAPAGQSITVPAVPPATFGDGPVTLPPTSSGGLTISYTVLSGPATVAGNVVTIIGAGTVVIRATQAGNASYTAAPDVPVTIVVNPAPQAITFPPITVPFAPGLTVTLAATASSGLPISYSVVSGLGTVSGNVLIIAGAGAVVVQADQGGDANDLAAVSVQQTVTVNPGPQTITFPPPPPPAALTPGATVTLAATGGPSGNPITYTVVSGPATVSGNVLTITGAGAIVIQADQAGTADFAPVSVRQALTVRPAATLLGNTLFAVGSGDTPTVKFYNADGTLRSTLTPFPGFTGGIRTATGDFNGDGVADLVVGTGPGAASHVRILDGATGAQLFAVDPFEASFTGGVYVAAGDVTGDGIADLAITPDEGGGPRVDVYNGKAFVKLASFFGIDDPNFRGGARATIADLNADGVGDLIVVAGFGGGPRVAGFDGTSLTGTPKKLFGDFFAFEQTLRNGIFVTAGDINGDGYADLVAGGGPGGGPRVLVFDGKSLLANQYVTAANFFGGNVDSRGGIRLAVKDLDGDAKADLVVGAGTGAGSHVTAYLGKTIAPAGTPPTAFEFDAIDGSADGVYVG